MSDKSLLGVVEYIERKFDLIEAPCAIMVLAQSLSLVGSQAVQGEDRDPVATLPQRRRCRFDRHVRPNREGRMRTTIPTWSR